MGGVNTILTVILVILGGLMTFLIMLQEGKGGGLAALGGTKAAGIEGVTNPIRRATAYMAIMFFLLAVVLGVMNRPTQNNDWITDTKEEAKAADAATPVSVPPANAGAQNPINLPEFETKPTVTPAAVPVPIKAVAPEAPKGDAPKPDAAKDVKPDAPKADAPKVDPAKADPAKNDPAKAPDPVKPEVPKAPEPTK